MVPSAQGAHLGMEQKNRPKGALLIQACLSRQLNGAKPAEANLDGTRLRDDTNGQQAYLDIPGLWY